MEINLIKQCFKFNLSRLLQLEINIALIETQVIFS